MPHAPALLPADRFFARLDKFECECPSCGQLIFAALEEKSAPVRLQAIHRRRSEARRLRANKSVRGLAWNPHSQRLACPHCTVVFVAGLLLYPVKQGSRPHMDAPPDVVPTRRQLAQMRQATGGFWAREAYEPRASVNLAIDSPCSCGGPGKWAPACPIHGDPAHGGGGPVAEPA